MDVSQCLGCVVTNPGPHTDRQRDPDTKNDRETFTQTHGGKKRQSDRQDIKIKDTENLVSKRTCWETDKDTFTQTHGKKTDRQTNRQRQIEIDTFTQIIISY